MTVRSGAGRSSAGRLATAMAALALMASAACSSSPADPGTTSSAHSASGTVAEPHSGSATPQSPQGSTIVTVPGLTATDTRGSAGHDRSDSPTSQDSGSGKPDESGTASSSGGEAPTTTAASTTTAATPTTAAPTTTDLSGTGDENGSGPTTSAAGSTDSESPGAPTAPTVTTTSEPAATTTSEPSTSPGTNSDSSADGHGAVNGVSVDPSVCAGCTSVIAAAPNVVGQYSAALMATAKTPALISLRPDGSMAGIINVIWGATFPSPAGRALPCGSAGRCIVAATQADGTPILSAFALSSDGAWRDVSGSDGFRSMTSRSGVVDLGGGEWGIAIQQAGDGEVAWVVLAWSGQRYTPIGCAPDSSSLPAKGDLSVDACLS